MNRKMTCLAGAGTWAARAASGLVAGSGAARARSRVNRSRRAQVPNPSPARRSISRRERKGGSIFMVASSIEVKELVGVEQGQTQFRQRVRPVRQERHGALLFHRRYGPAKGQQP